MGAHCRHTAGPFQPPRAPQLQAHAFPQDRSPAPLATESNSPSLLLRLTLQLWDRLHIPAAFTATSFHPLASEGYNQSQIWPQI